MKVFAITLSTVLLAVVTQGQEPAPDCTDACQLPTCRCSGTDIPGGLNARNIPQLVFLTFDDSVTNQNHPFYKQIFTKERKNPNGHPITGTFFITHQSTEYPRVHDLWRDGHEIALHSISHRSNTGYWRDLNESMWRQEVVEQREQVAMLSRIPAADIKGLRAPFLQTGGDRMYKVLADAAFQYECSRPTLAYRQPGMWPYTNDYRSIQECQIPPCPVGRYPGFWTVPMVDSLGDNGAPCSMTDTCLPAPEKEDVMFNLLLRNFNAQYEGNRAPFGIYIHHAWVNGTQDYDEVDQRRAGFERFIDHILTLADVYMVSVTRGLEWVKAPKNLEESKTFPAFQVTEKPNLCPREYTCHYPNDQTPFPGEAYMYSCITCPLRYPWVGNHLGRP